MPQKYTNEFKKNFMRRLKEYKLPTKRSAEEANIPLKTLEKWITAYNKDPHCFDEKKN